MSKYSDISECYPTIKPYTRASPPAFDNTESKDNTKAFEKSDNEDHGKVDEYKIGKSEDDSCEEEEKKEPSTSYKDSETGYIGIEEEKIVKKIFTNKKIKYNEEEFRDYLNTFEKAKERVVDIKLKGGGYSEEAIRKLAEELKGCPRIKVCFTLQD